MAVGYPLCPNDAHKVKYSMKILPSNGGDGVIRDFFDFLDEVNYVKILLVTQINGVEV